jgi:hypothetical protein
MPVRHVVEANNVDQDGFIVDPALGRHCVIQAGALLDVSGPVDPTTHLNVDFVDHLLNDCVIAEGFQRGALVLRQPDGQPLLARLRPQALRHLGRVDVDARRIAWLEALRARREERADAGH